MIRGYIEVLSGVDINVIKISILLLVSEGMKLYVIIGKIEGVIV